MPLGRGLEVGLLARDVCPWSRPVAYGVIPCYAFVCFLLGSSVEKQGFVDLNRQ